MSVATVPAFQVRQAETTVKMPSKIAPHPLSDAFRMMDDKAFAELKRDIKDFGGNREPIVLYDGMILDGRNRDKACRELKIKPRYKVFDGDDPARYVWQMNGLRRHLTKNEQAAIAADMLPRTEADRSRRKGRRSGQRFESQRQRDLRMDQEETRHG